jgi:hypothetical protein
MCVKKLCFDGRNPHNFETRKGELVGDKISRGCAFPLVKFFLQVVELNLTSKYIFFENVESRNVIK